MLSILKKNKENNKNIIALTKEEQLIEIKRCKADPSYFAKNYVYIKNKDSGAVKFKLWDFQENVLKDLKTHKLNIVLKARQLGLTELASLYVLWYTLFSRDKNVVIVSKNRKSAANVIKRIKYAYKKLPDWLKVTRMVADNVHSIEFDNDSIIFADATTSNAGRGEAVSLFVVDEAAFIDCFEELWTSVRPTLDKGACIILSTPNGASGAFYELYKGAPDNGFNPIKLNWDVHPDRDQTWFVRTKSSMSTKAFAQEYLCLGKGSKIITIDGYKNIENIQIGDLVLTHKGNFKPVTKLYNRFIKSSELYTITSPLARGYPLVITGNHPILVAEKNPEYISENIRKFIQNNIHIENFKSLEELDLNSVVKKFEMGIFPKLNLQDNIRQETIDLAKYNLHYELTDDILKYYRQGGKGTKRFFKEDYEFGKFLGLYIAEGYFDKKKDRFFLAFHSDESNLVKFISDFFDKHNINFSLTDRRKFKNASNCIIINSANKFLRPLIKEYVIGDYAYNKQLPDNIFTKNKEFIRGILAGIWLGDGFHDPKKRNVLSLTSEKLIFQLRTLLSGFDIITRISERDNTIYGPNNLIQYYIEINNVFGRDIEDCLLNGIEYQKQSHTILQNNVWWGRPDIGRYSLSLTEQTEVFNIEVEEDNTYCTPGLIVHNCDFALSGDTVIDADDIARHASRVKDNYEYLGNTSPLKEVWIWKEYQIMDRYVISGDVSRGDSEDYSAFHVINADSHEVVAEYKGKIKVDKFAQLLIHVAQLYGSALIVVENNSFGLAVLMKLIELKYPNIYWEEKGTHSYSEGFVDFENDDNIVPGFTTSMSSRILMMDLLEESLRLDKIIIYSKRMVDELRNFIYENGKPKARKGTNDDLVMALSIGLYVASLVFPNKESDIELRKKILENFRVIESFASTKLPNERGYDQNKDILRQSNPADPYKYKYGDKTEIDFRCLVNDTNTKGEKPKQENKGINFLGFLR